MNSTIAQYFGISAGAFTTPAIMAGVASGVLPAHGGLLALPVAVGAATGVYQYRKMEREDAIWLADVSQKMDIIIADEICKRL